MKRKIIISSSVLLLLMVVFTIIYHRPVKKQLTASATTLEGNTIDIAFDISYQKYFFRPTEIYGDIMVDGILFTRQKHQSIINRGNFIQKILNKIDNIINSSYEPQLFILDQAVGSVDNFKSLQYKPNEKYFVINIYHMDNIFEIENYYGPAVSIEEVEAILLYK